MKRKMMWGMGVLLLAAAASIAQTPPKKPAQAPREVPPVSAPARAPFLPPVAPTMESLPPLPTLPALPSMPALPSLPSVPSLPPLSPVVGLGWDDEDEAQSQAEREQEQREREQERKEREREREADRIEREQDLYENGTEAIEEGRYERAADAFAKVAAMKGKKADGALYWQAYALHKLGRKQEALNTIGELLKSYPQSRWLKDAKSLEVEVQQSTGQPVKPGLTDEEELQSIALNTCMHSDPERCVPMIEKFLQGNRTPKLKRRALFVLAQSGSAQAREVLAKIAKGDANPEIQTKAIEYLGLFGGKTSLQTLADIYASTANPDVKRRILRAFMMAGDKERLLNAAKTEKDADLRRAAVEQLGVVGARSEVWQLYQGETSAEVRSQILLAMFISGDTEHMAELARAEKDTTLRRKAIRNLGLMGGGKRGASTGDALVAIYTSDKDPGVRREVINALFLQQNATAMVQIAKQETDPALRKAIVEKLSLMHSKEATDYLMEILNK